MIDSKTAFDEAVKKLALDVSISDRLASVGTLAAGVAHEINNPLAYVKSNLEFAVAELVSGTTQVAEIVAALREALDGAERVRIIVRDLKNFARADDTPARELALVPLIASALEIAASQLHDRALLVKDFQPLPTVVGDEFKLGQVVLNLLTNAAHAIRPGARDQNRIWIRTMTDADGWAVVEVEDTGPGIPAELRARVFDPFFTTKPQGTGTGLGLSVCHGLVSAIGGQIILADGTRGGCRVRMRLPPAVVALPVVAPRASAPRPTRPSLPRVLVVDDEALVAKAACRSLQRDHTVLWVDSARAALELLDHGAVFDVMLCDVMMPQMNGIELYVELQRRAAPIADRFIFVTGGTFTPAAQHFLEASGVPSLEKPFRLEDLRQAISFKLAA